MSKSTNKYNTEIKQKFNKLQYENRNWGFTKFSEKINGRFAMIGFLLLYSIELITKKEFLELLLPISNIIY